jgi:hypothetical protein
VSEQDFSSEIVDLTPTAAENMLRRNNRNRSLRPDYVRQLAGAMERGEWVVNGEPIQLAEDGTVLNGQHRLSAVVESRTTVPMLVVRGLPTGSQKTMDVGARRTLSDVLSLHGERYTTSLGAALTLLYRYRAGTRLDNGRVTPTVPQALALLREEPGIKDCVVEARRVWGITRMRISVGALLLYLFEEADPGQGEAFFQVLCNPTGEGEGSPVLKLRAHLDRVSSERNYKFSTRTLSAMTIKAFNAWREGRPIEYLTYRPGGKNPEAFPEILTPKELEGTT